MASSRGDLLKHIQIHRQFINFIKVPYRTIYIALSPLAQLTPKIGLPLASPNLDRVRNLTESLRESIQHF